MTQTLTISRLGHLGDGLATTADGVSIVVPGTLAGEEVTGDIEDNRMAAPRILRPSDDRVRPPCSHANSCGGCLVQHASDTLVASWKRQMVVDALRAQDITAEIGETLTSPDRSRRRAGFTGRRTKKGALIGFHGRRSHTLIPVPDCLVITKNLIAVQEVLESIVRVVGTRKGEINFQVTDTLGGPDVAATGGKPLDLNLRQDLVEIGARAGLARLTWDGETVAEWADPSVAMGKAKVKLPPGAFLQATAHGEAALLAVVEDVVGKASKVADLFCGCGTFALPLASHADVLAVESDPAQTAALSTGWRNTPNLHQMEVQTRDLFRRPLSGDDFKGVEAVVIDPPRAGAAAQIADLAESDIQRIAAVSCSPATFARDAATLIAGGYRMGPVTVVDQFRWSPHVELAAGFYRD